MRIAMLSSISWRTPPRGYGPWELVTSLLTEALVARGIDVTLFATLGSATAGTLAGVVPRGYSEDPTLDAKVWEALHVAHLFERAGEFDLIHNQADFMPLVFARMVAPPIVTTIHGFSSPRILPVFERYDDRVHYVAISDADRAPSLSYAATIHHGIRVEEFPFDAQGGEGLLFFGRIHPDKGAGEAIRAAQATGHRLAMYGLAVVITHTEAQLLEGTVLAEHIVAINLRGLCAAQVLAGVLEQLAHVPQRGIQPLCVVVEVPGGDAAAGVEVQRDGRGHALGAHGDEMRLELAALR